MNIQVISSGSKGNCYIVDDDKTRIMLECGIRYNAILKGCNYDINISGCLVSHAHVDHSLAIQNLLNNGIPVYTSAEVYKALKINDYLAKEVNAGQQFKIGTFIIIPFDLQHVNSDGSPCKNFGYLIYSTATKDKLLFATDTAYIHNQFKGLTDIMIETNYIEKDFTFSSDKDVAMVEKRRFASHMSLETALDFLKHTDLSTVNQIYAIHLSEGKANKKYIEEKLQEATGKLIVVC